MKETVVKRLLFALLGNAVVLAVIEVLFYLALGVMGVRGFPFVTTFIAAAVLSAIAAGVLSYFYADFERKRYHTSNGESEWLKKKISLKKMNCTLIPHFLTALICVVVFVLCYKSFNELLSVDDFTQEASRQVMRAHLLSALMGSVAMFQLIHFIVQIYRDAKIACPQCHAMFSFVQYEKVDYGHSREKVTKTVTRSENVGGVYCDGKKVGEVYQDRDIDYEGEIHVSSWTSKCRCVFCGQEVDISDSFGFFTGWK